MLLKSCDAIVVSKTGDHKSQWVRNQNIGNYFLGGIM
jgi:hypothetical protein